MASDISLSALEIAPGREALRRLEPESDRADFARSVIAGLSLRPRQIPCRFFYDAKGSALFEEITGLDEYYPTRTETALLKAHGGDMAAAMDSPELLVEFGSGSSRKTSLLLAALPHVKTYVPIDVSESSLDEAAAWLKRRHHSLRIVPMLADFTKAVALPRAATRGKRAGFFSGSTIGNLKRQEARRFLANAARLLGRGSTLLIGVDLKKSLDLLLPAYNDARGITAAFNLNLLARINRELGGTFDVSAFAHDAIWNEGHGRIEMHLVSRAAQSIEVLGRRFRFRAGDRIHTENSHKYSIAEFQGLAASAGWKPVQVWTDAGRLFSLHLLTF